MTHQYAEAVKDVGGREGVPVVDLWTVLYEAVGRDEKKLSEFLYDGLHLNEKGYEVCNVRFDSDVDRNTNAN